MARYPYTTCNVALARAALGPPIYSFLQQRSNISSSKNPDSKKKKTASKRDPGGFPHFGVHQLDGPNVSPSARRLYGTPR